MAAKDTNRDGQEPGAPAAVPSSQPSQQPRTTDLTQHDRNPKTSRQGQTIPQERRERGPDDVGEDASAEQGLRSGDAMDPEDVDPATQRDEAASGAAPIRKGPPPKFPREQQPASRG